MNSSHVKVRRLVDPYIHPTSDLRPLRTLSLYNVTPFSSLLLTEQIVPTVARGQTDVVLWYLLKQLMNRRIFRIGTVASAPAVRVTLHPKPTMRQILWSSSVRHHVVPMKTSVM